MVSAVVLHQHTNNFGDDVAGAALVETLLGDRLLRQVDVYYIWHRGGGALPIDDRRLTHHKLDLLAGRQDNRPKLAFFAALSMLSPRFVWGEMRALVRACTAADVVFVAPAGSNIGIYKDWTYLLSLAVIVRAGARPLFCQNTVAESRSRIFDAVARWVLRRSDVFVREARSQAYLTSLGIPSKLGVDTALLLEAPEARKGDGTRHLTIVPTRLGTWHRDHRDFDDQRFLGHVLPEAVASFALERGLDVHVLAHLYGPEREDDVLQTVRDALVSAGCAVHIVMPRDYIGYWQDLSDADVVLSMRYHGLVLSGAASTPCVALSYENKMREAARYLGMEDLVLDVAGTTSAHIKAMLHAATGPEGPASEALHRTSVQLREVARGPLDAFFGTASDVEPEHVAHDIEREVSS